MVIETASRTQAYWVYILYCQNQHYYTGYTQDMVKRYQAHLNGKSNCKYTRSFRPLYIAQCWKINGNRAFAMKIESEIKKLSRAEKEKIIAAPSLLSTDPRVEVATETLCANNPKLSECLFG